MWKRPLILLAVCAPLALLWGCAQVGSECSLDTDCPGDEICADGSCVECETSADCAAGETCTNGTCVVAQDECDENDDCGVAEVCSDGQCVVGSGGNPAAGQAFYTSNGCNVCHGASGEGSSGPNIQDATPEAILDNIAGDDPHNIKVEGATLENAQDVAAFLDSL